MTTTQPPPAVDAFRVASPSGPTVRIAVDGVLRRVIDGSIAARAHAVVVGEYREPDATGGWSDVRALYASCRTDDDTARREAEHLSRSLPAGFLWAIAVPIIEARTRDEMARDLGAAADRLAVRQGVPTMPAGSFTVEPPGEALELVNRADPSCEACAGLGFVDQAGVRLVCACVAQRRVGT